MAVTSSASCFGSLAMPAHLQLSQLDHCSVIITDVDRSRKFYRDLLGLKEINRPRTFDFVVLWFELGDTALHLMLKDKADPISPRLSALRGDAPQVARRYFQENGI